MKKHKLDKLFFLSRTRKIVSKTVPNLFFLAGILFIAMAVNAQERVYVAPGGTGDGSSWDSPMGSFIAAANKSTSESEVIVYVKLGTYYDNPGDYNNGGTSQDTSASNMPDGKNVTIIGGYATNLTSQSPLNSDGSPCGYNPAANPTNLDDNNQTNARDGASWFRVDEFDGNLTIKGFNFTGYNSAELTISPILTVFNKDNGTFKIEDMYLSELAANKSNPGIGALLHIKGTATGNTFEVDNVVTSESAESGIISLTSTTGGNTVNVSNSSFNKSSVTITPGGGGAIRVQGDANNPNILNVDNSTFCENKAISLFGGAIGLNDKTIATITNSYFYGNDATGGINGGAIAVRSGSILNSTGNVYERNLAGNGGAIYASASKVISTNDKFIFNGRQIGGVDGVNGNGGAVDILGNSGDGDAIEDYQFIGAKFYGNKANSDGGAIKTDLIGKNLKITGSEFLENTADDGGAIHSSADIYLDSCKFDKNLADTGNGTGRGGAIYSSNSGMYVANSCFNENVSMDGGAAIYVGDNGNQSRYFDVPAGISTSDGESTVRHVAYNNSFTANTTGFNTNVLGDDGVVGGAIVYNNVRAAAAADVKGGNIVFANNKVFNNVTYFDRGLVNVYDLIPASGFTLRGLAVGSDGDNVVAFQNNEFAGNTIGPATGTQSATEQKVDVAITNADANAFDYDGAIFNTDGTKFQNAPTTANYPLLLNPTARDWEGIETNLYTTSGDVTPNGVGYDYNDIKSVAVSGDATVAETSTLGNIPFGNGDVLYVQPGDNTGNWSFTGVKTASAKNYTVSGKRSTNFWDTNDSGTYSFNIMVPAASTITNTFNNTDTSDGVACTLTAPTHTKACFAATGINPAYVTADDCTDTDGDGVPDYQDLDSDNDGIPDSVEVGSDPANPVDTDGDGVPDYRDLDSDNDGQLDVNEGGNGALDTNNDGVIDSKDQGYLDANNDGMTDSTLADATTLDADGDGTPDWKDPNATDNTTTPPTYPTGADTDEDGILDTNDSAPSAFGVTADTDGDGVSDADEIGSDPANPVDTDGDGVPDYKDLDSDNDGIPDSVEVGCTPTAPATTCTPVDTDGDGIPDYRDLDSDNDGKNDIVEAGGTDTNGDGMVDSFTDADNDGLHDPIDNQTSSTPDGGVTQVTSGTQLPDTDTDGVAGPDRLTVPSGDTVYTPADADSDGIPDSVDVTQTGGTDANGDGIDDSFQTGTDTDGDGIADAHDPDKDGDGIIDVVDGQPTAFGDAIDTDGDGISDADEMGSDPANPVDTDGDGIPDYKDLDSDNDGIPDSVEGNVDTDGDGVPNYRDLDSDNDGENDIEETNQTDVDGDGMVDSFTDADKDGLHDPVDEQTSATPDGSVTQVTNGTEVDATTDPDGTSNYTTPDTAPGASDTNGDGYADGTDSDGDGILDTNDGAPNAFGDAKDTDGDGVSDADEIGSDPANPVDTDGDGVPDYKDLDSDNDGIPDNVEVGCTPTAPAISCTPVDTDGDGIPDYKDLDSDNDGKNDIVEAGGTDANGDGMVDSFADADNDGLHDPIDNQTSSTPDGGVTQVTGGTQLPDTDTDGVAGPDRLTVPSGDTVYTPADADSDGIPDSVDVTQTGGTDANGDGIDDAFQTGTDTDGDGIADAHDPDKDGDGVVDVVDGQPTAFGDASLVDYSDAPAGYPVLSVSNSYANAFVPSGANSVWAGDQVSYEVEQQTATDASGDGYDDGLVIKTQASELGQNVVFTVSVNSSQLGATVYYELRVDWNNDSTYDTTIDGSVSTVARMLGPGSGDVTVQLPSSYVDGTPVNVRLVVASTAADASTTTGQFTNGEIEDYQFTTAQILPVELQDFTVVANGADAQLAWSTATEVNNSHFVVERSLNGIAYEAVARVEGKGTTSERSNYSYTDVNVGKSFGVVYYRLKQVDYTGDYTYSFVKSVRYEGGDSGLVLYPNPVNQTESFVVESKSIKTIKVVSMTGQLIESFEFDGSTNRQEISTSTYSSGTYVVLVNNEERKLLIVD